MLMHSTHGQQRTDGYPLCVDIPIRQNDQAVTFINGGARFLTDFVQCLFQACLARIGRIGNVDCFAAPSRQVLKVFFKTKRIFHFAVVNQEIPTL